MLGGQKGQDAMGEVEVEQMILVHQFLLHFLHFHYCLQNGQIAQLLDVAVLVQGLPQLGEMNAKTEDTHSHDFLHCYCYSQTFCLTSLNFVKMMTVTAVVEEEGVHSFLQKLMQNQKRHCF